MPSATRRLAAWKAITAAAVLALARQLAR
jgi:hypothetical protein